MMKRVNKSCRIMVSILLIAVCAFVAYAPEAEAREDISVGQSGDPTDGLDADSCGSSTQPDSHDIGGNMRTPSGAPLVILIPVMVGGFLVFSVVLVPIGPNARS